MRVELEQELTNSIQQYVDMLSYEQMIDIIRDNLWDYYRDCADEEETRTFIQEVKDLTQ
jgi:hypothetical protein|tara:strand:+ start:159 stop:335 length:177 start_codon:yes stop_codon:yes gene_type:complete